MDIDKIKDINQEWKRYCPKCFKLYVYARKYHKNYIGNGCNGEIISIPYKNYDEIVLKCYRIKGQKQAYIKALNANNTIDSNENNKNNIINNYPRINDESKSNNIVNQRVNINSNNIDAFSVCICILQSILYISIISLILNIWIF